MEIFQAEVIKSMVTSKFREYLKSEVKGKTDMAMVVN